MISIQALGLLMVGTAMITGLLTSWAWHARTRPWRQALLRVANDDRDHACLQHNTAAGAIEWAQRIALAAIAGAPAPPALGGAMKLNFPAHCERLAEELLELGDRRPETRPRGKSPEWVRVLMNVVIKENLNLFQMEQVIRHAVWRGLGCEDDRLGIDIATIDGLEVELVGVQTVQKLAGDDLKLNLEGMAATLFEAAGAALLEQAYGGESRRVPVEKVKGMVEKADALRLRAQELD